MGWTWIEEMLAAEAERSGEREPDDTGFEESEPAEMEEEPSRHPLVARLINRSATLVKLAGDRRDNDLEEMIGGFMAVWPQLNDTYRIMRPSHEAHYGCFVYHTSHNECTIDDRLFLHHI